MAFDCLRSQFLTRQNCPMCSHYVGQTPRAKFARLGVALPLGWVPPPVESHVYPTQQAAIIRRPPELDSGDEAVPAMEVVTAHFGKARLRGRPSWQQRSSALSIASATPLEGLCKGMR